MENGGDRVIEYEQLFKDHFHSVYRYVYYMVGNKADAEDVTQEIFIKIAQHYEDFRGDSSISTWIFTIARRAVIDFARKKKTIKYLTFWKHHIPENMEFEGNLEIPGESLLKQEQAEEIHRIIKQLPEKLQTVIYLRWIKGLTVQETAGLLNISINQVSVRQNRAMSKLRGMLDSEILLKEESI